MTNPGGSRRGMDRARRRGLALAPSGWVRDSGVCEEGDCLDSHSARPRMIPMGMVDAKIKKVREVVIAGFRLSSHHFPSV